MSFEDLINNLNSDELFIQDGLILLAFSGGPDSVFMAELMRKKYSDKELVLYHLNHMIREEAIEDETFVRDYANRHGIKLYVNRVNIPKEAREKSLGLEEAGRLVRYTDLTNLAKELGTRTVITSHHLDDDIETFLMNFYRGAGANGAGGIKMRDGVYFRPMLSIKKDEILDYLNINNIKYVIDRTNFIPDTRRNKIRLEIIPKLKTYDERFYSNFGSLISGIKKQNLLLYSLVDEYISSNANFEYGIGIKISDIKQRFNYDRGVLYLRVIERLIGSKKDIYRKNIEEIDGLLDKQGEKIYEIGKMRIIKSYDYLYFTKKTDIFEPSHLYLTDELGEEESYLARLPKDIIVGKPYFDRRKSGDSFELANGYTKSVKNLMIDSKVPRFKRDKLNLLRDDLGILYIEGIGLSKRCNIKTDKYLYVVERGKYEPIS